MSKEHAVKPAVQYSEVPSYLPAYLIPKVQSKIIPKVFSRIQTKLLTDLGKNKQKPETATSTKLPEEVQSKMETSFGQDFSSVALHSDSKAAENIHAKAYTQGSEVHFAPGQYNPGSKEGQELIGHELTHVVQQQAGRVGQGELHGKDTEINKDTSLEKEADEAGKLASEGKSVTVQGIGSGIQRKEGDTTIEDKGPSDHAKGNFDPDSNRYTVPGTEAYASADKAFDTLFSISRRFGISVDAIRKANGLESDAVVAGQVLIIPAGGIVKEILKPMPIKTTPVPVKTSAPVKTTEQPPRPPVAIQKDEAAELIDKHTSLLMLNEETLAKELVEKYLFGKPTIVSSVLHRISFYNRDDVSVAILDLLPVAQWNKIDKTLLKEFHQHMQSGLNGGKEKGMILHLSILLGSKKEEVKKQEPVKKTVLPELKKQEPTAKRDSTAVAPKKRETPSDTGAQHLFAIEQSKAGAEYLEQMYENKNEGKWQKEDLLLPNGLTKADERVELAKQIEDKDERKYGLVVIANGRLTDNIVDCAEFISEIAWSQGHQTYPSGACVDQLSWFKKNAEWGDNFDDIRVGDVIFWDRDKNAGVGNDHTGIIVEKLSDGSVKYIHASFNGGRESVNAPKYPTTENGTAYANQPEYKMNFLAWGRF